MLLHSLKNDEKVEASLITRIMQTEGKLPERLSYLPEAYPWLLHVLKAYVDLSTCRPTFESRIPWTAVYEYVKIHNLEVPPFTFDYYWEVITSMDDAYLNFVREKMEAARQS